VSRRRAGAAGHESERGGGEGEREGGATGGRSPPGRGLLAQVAILAAAFGLGVGVAELAGAANLGVALGVGQIVFAAALAYVLLER
jgi:hypothetical protein